MSREIVQRIRCDHDGCTAEVTIAGERVSDVRAFANSNGWRAGVVDPRKSGPSAMRDFCEEHAS